MACNKLESAFYDIGFTSIDSNDSLNLREFIKVKWIKDNPKNKDH